MAEKKIHLFHFFKLLLWKYIAFCRPQNLKIKGKFIVNRYTCLEIDKTAVVTINGDFELISTTLRIKKTILNCGKLIINNSIVSLSNSSLEFGTSTHLEKAQINFNQVEFSALEQCRLHNININAVESKFNIGSYFLAHNVRKEDLSWNLINATFNAGNNCRLQCNLYQHHSNFTLASNIFINAGTSISCIQQIEIGDYAMISYDCLLFDNNSHQLDFEMRRAEIDRGFPNSTNQAGNERPKSSPIVIKNDVWIGARCTVLKGVQIGDRVVVAANTTVTGNVEADNLVYTSATNYMSIKKNS